MIKKLRSKYNSVPVQVKASIWYTVCNFFQKGVSFIVVPIYVRILSTAEYGQWSVFQSWRDILIIFASLNLYAGVFTKTLVDIEDDRDRYTASMQGLGTVVTLFFLIIYCFSHEWCNRILDINTPLFGLLFLYFIVYPAFSFWGTRQRVENRYKPLVAVTILVSVLTPVVSLLLFFHTQLRTKALILGYLLVQCTVGLFFYVYHYLKGKCFVSIQYWKYALKFNIPLIPHYLSLIILGQSDRLMIKYFCGENDAGIYSFAYQIATIMNVFLAAINGSRVPWAYQQLRNRKYQPLRKVSNVLCILMAVITLAAAILSPEVIWIIGTEEYTQAVYVIPVVALGVYFTYCYDMFCTVEFYYGATKLVMSASVIGAAVNIVLNAIFIPKYGFIAAAYTTLASYILFMFMHYIFMHVVMRREHIDEEIYDIPFTLICSVSLSMAVAGCFLLFGFTVIRYLVIAAIIVALIAFRKTLINAVKTIRKR